MKVLIVENAPEVVDVTKMCISIRWGPQNSEFVTDYKGDRAVSLVESEKPDIVLMELDLPAVDGMKVLQEIRASSNVPIIVVSRKGDDLTKIKALEAGADDYIAKHTLLNGMVSYTELLSRIKAVIRRTTEVDFIGQLHKQGVTAEDLQKATKFPELLKALADAIKNATPHLFSP